MTDRATSLIAALGLLPHPEGGYYRELYRSTAVVQPEDERGSRAALTTIYFLLPAGSVSRWHRVQSDEVWHFYEGAPLDLWTAGPEGGSVQQRRLGSLQDAEPVAIVPAGWWQAAKSAGDYTLVGCTVAPGFDFMDFAFAADQPSVARVIRAGSAAGADLL